MKPTQEICSACCWWDDAAVDFVLSYGTCTAPVAGPTMVTAKLGEHW